MRRHKPWPVAIVCFSEVLFVPSLALADDPMVLLDSDGLVVRAHLQAGLNVVSEHNLFWNYADTFAAGAGFNANPTWLEGYVKPGLSFSKELTSVVSAYGLISLVASGTLGIDAYDTGNTGRITLEEGYLGLRSTNKDGSPTFDISVGPREFKAGTGMLLANGGSSGFDRGALKLGPRKAWEQAAIGRVGIDGFTGTAFFLDANELSDTDSNTRIAGADLRYDAGPENFAGVTLGHVLDSDAPYPKAAPNGIGAPSILPGGRDGLNFTNLYGRVSPEQGSLEDFFVGGDFAYEWNDRIDMAAWAGRVQVGYTFTEYSWAPTITYSYQTFSGDDPSTSKLERFDPLFYEGSPSSWSTGSKSSMLFINSNVNAHQISLRVTPNPRDTFTLRYSYIDVNELRSPIQFGQATRVDDSSEGVPNAITGATARHLADDIFLEYNRVLTPNIYLTAGFSVSFPGPGAASLVNGNLPVWTGGFVNVVANY
ncbi:alginate export family protein [Mesorhizobium sp.]|uniref:alginate export family protein n=1 Tax=Mesorhizobium sp. TaxID=1871066 RepID=UPI003BA85993